MPKTKKTRQGRKKCGVAGQPKHVLTEEEQRKGRDAAKSAIVQTGRSFATKISVALREQLAKVDEATQETLAEVVARRLAEYLMFAGIDRTYLAAVAETGDRTEGRPTQAITVSETKSIDDRTLPELLFHERNDRWPTKEEEEWFKQYGGFPDA